MFIPDTVEINDDEDTESDEDYPQKKSKAKITFDELNAKGIRNNEEEDATQLEVLSADFFKQGWACYPKQDRNVIFSKETILLLAKIFERGNQDKCRKISAERAQVVAIDEVATRDWKERAILSVYRIKSFFQ